MVGKACLAGIAIDSSGITITPEDEGLDLPRIRGKCREIVFPLEVNRELGL